jgi:hypothetical protein
MNKTRSKYGSILIVLFLTITISASIILIPTVSAHNPPWTIEDKAYISLAPNPIGVGQTLPIEIWTAQPFPNVLLTNNIRKGPYTLIVTAPDGTNTTQYWATIPNPGGEQGTDYIPTQVGNYTATFIYGGQIYPTLSSVVSSVPLTTAMVASINGLAGDTYTPETVTLGFTVTQQPLPAAINSYPLPTQYWTHPIEGQNTYWYTISSNWLGSASQDFLGSMQQTSPSENLYNPYGIAPNTGHIMWTRPIEFGGVVGGGNTAVNGATYYSGSSYEGRFVNAIIMNGILYFKMPLSDASTASGAGSTYVNAGPYTALDLRTGQVIWQNPNINPTWGELLNFVNPNQSGVIPSGFLWESQSFGTNKTWICYDGASGTWIFNVTNVPAGTTVYEDNGNLDIYVLNYNVAKHVGWLAEWNMTDAVSGGGVIADLSTGWRPVGQIFNGAAPTAYEWNVTITTDLDGYAVDTTGTSPNGVVLVGPTIYSVIPGSIIFGTSSNLASSVGPQYTPNPFTMWVMNLNATNGPVGQLYWIHNYTAPAVISNNPVLGAFTQRLASVDPVNGIITMYVVETFQLYGYSLYTGQQVWGPTNTTFPTGFQYFGSGSGGGQWMVTAYGQDYVAGYGGVVYDYNTSNGQLVWQWGNGGGALGSGNSTNDGLNTPWGLEPVFIAAIADGKVYAVTDQHGNGAQSPYYKGNFVAALDAATGKQIWSMMSMPSFSGGTGISCSVLADGFLVYDNYYDNQLYSVGRGPSQTTVTAPNPITTIGAPMIIRGSVTDISAGTKQNEQAADFPNGVPAVSDDSMSAWMEYVYMQKPEPTNATGVPVTISVIDSNGNQRVIGTTTSDSSGIYTLTWKPDIPGSYTVIANFAGSSSYWPSSAETSFFAGEAPTTPGPAAVAASNVATTTDLMTYIVVATIAIIIAIALVGFLVMRKKL